MRTTKRSSEGATLVAQACTNVEGFSDMYRRLKRRMSTSGRSTSTLCNYARHLAQMALHFNESWLTTNWYVACSTSHDEDS